MSSIVIHPAGGDKAIDRTGLLITMMTDAALGQLRDLGYEREFDELMIVNDDGFPTLEFKGETIFQVVLNVDAKKGISIDGEWLFQPPKRRFLRIRRVYRWLVRQVWKITRW